MSIQSAWHTGKANQLCRADKTAFRNEKKSIRYSTIKVTDHAIIPTGIQVIQYNQQQVYDIITKRFIAFYTIV
jgi:DNA topoisomerase IA